jgi:exopolyphosphatase/guanosine-5'-triphosphate,3'-diphosphate pyrophosphatase
MAGYLCEKYLMDLPHIKHVADLARVLFRGFTPHLGLRRPELLYLELAAYLRDLGMFIHNRAHHKHTEYIISSLTLFRLTDDEMKIIACVARYHRKAPPLARHPLYASLPSDKQILVQKLSSLLRIANALDCSHKQKVRTVEVETAGGQEIRLVARTNEGLALENAMFQDRKMLLEEITGSNITLVVKR